MRLLPIEQMIVVTVGDEQFIGQITGPIYLLANRIGQSRTKLANDVLIEDFRVVVKFH